MITANRTIKFRLCFWNLQQRKWSAGQRKKNKQYFQCVCLLCFFFRGGGMFFTLHLIYFHPVSQPRQLLLPYFVGEEIVTQPSMTWPHAQTMQRGGGLRVHSDDRTVRQSLAAANELRQTRAHPGPNHGEHWDVGQTAHTRNILSAWVDASWGVISVTTEVPQKAKDERVTEMLTRSSKRRRDSRSQNGSAVLSSESRRSHGWIF